MTDRWHFWIDRGGTFTDVIALTPDRRIATAKLLSTAPGRYEDAAVQGIRDLIGVADGVPIPAGTIGSVKMGTTVATNALLERRGEPVVLVVTAGFADLLAIGNQARPAIFARAIVKPERLETRTIEARERMTVDGEVLVPLDAVAVRADLQAAHDDGFRAVAIALMHGYRHSDHERAIAAIARAVGFTQVSVSHEVSPLARIVGRGDTTVVDAYLSPVLDRYVARVEVALGTDVPLAFMQSNGGLAGTRAFRGRDAILSGPAGGVVGMVETARAAGFDRIVGFDMGGTSTDVSHYAGDYERTVETVVAGVPIRVPMMAIETIAAGGGSICRFESGRLQVGPQSAGADPGPACYRRGGPLTVTDCNVLLGKLRPDGFPRLFGPDGDQPIDAEIVRDRFAALAAEVVAAGYPAQSPEALAEGFLAIAVGAMAAAIKRISIAHGHDVADYALACFGGAAGQHACLVADALGIGRAIVHPLAGVLSAYGIGLADQRVLRRRSIEAEWGDAALDEARAAIDMLADDVRGAIEADGFDVAAARERRTLFLRYAGSDATVEVTESGVAEAAAAFEAGFRRRFGFATPDVALMLESVAIELIVPSVQPDATIATGTGTGRARDVGAYMGGAPVTARLVARGEVAAGTRLAGPAIVHDEIATIVVEPGWTAHVGGRGDLILERAITACDVEGDTTLDPVRLEIFNNLFMAVAERMGEALRASAMSVNIRERLDFSCALFDRDGALIANAPHIPVHLGSMGDSVRAVRERTGEGLADGDAYVINNPYDGGTHLPDLTVVMPVSVAGAIAFWVAARGHHADVGGTTPGSMPAGSRTLDEEGVLFDGLRIVAGGRFDEAAFRGALAGGAWPARDPDRNVGDVRAQIAACARGADELRALASRYGHATVAAYMEHVQANAADAVRAVIDGLDDGRFEIEMDDGARIVATLAVDRAGRSATIDFAGTAAQRTTNFNAPPAIARAAVLYVLRTLVDTDIPLNDGCLRPVAIRIPEGSMLRPHPPAAVVAGNVEVSQAIVDALYGACGRMAGSQGTMNNLTFGDATHQYYETICGGAGAGPGFAGADAVQTHMTNSRITDPEVLEARFPVLLETFTLRRGSGGGGSRRGGDGVVRRIRFREPATATILANRRRVPPRGLAGGEDGATGTNRVIRADGTVEPLAGTASVAVAADDAIEIATPGGGGYGRPEPDADRARGCSPTGR